MSALFEKYADDVLDPLWKLYGNDGVAYKTALKFHAFLQEAEPQGDAVERACKANLPQLAEPSEVERKHMRAALAAAYPEMQGEIERLRAERDALARSNMEALDIAMRMTAKAGIPYHAEFAAIAQSLDAACVALVKVGE